MKRPEHEMSVTNGDEYDDGLTAKTRYHMSVWRLPLTLLIILVMLVISIIVFSQRTEATEKQLIGPCVSAARLMQSYDLLDTARDDVRFLITHLIGDGGEMVLIYAAGASFGIFYEIVDGCSEAKFSIILARDIPEIVGQKTFNEFMQIKGI